MLNLALDGDSHPGLRLWLNSLQFEVQWTAKVL